MSRTTELKLVLIEMFSKIAGRTISLGNCPLFSEEEFKRLTRAVDLAFEEEENGKNKKDNPVQTEDHSR